MNIISLVLEFYFMRLVLGLIAFYYSCKVLKKYLKVDVIEILRTGFNNIKMIIKYFKNRV